MKRFAIAATLAVMLFSGSLLADHGGKSGQGNSGSVGSNDDGGKDNGKNNGKNNDNGNGKGNDNGNGKDNDHEKGPKTHIPDPKPPSHKMSADEMGAAGLTLATLLAAGVYLVRRRK